MNQSKTCTFTGHRPERLTIKESEVKDWLKEHIETAIANGYTNFVTGMQRGIDIWAAEEVIRQKEAHPELNLVAASAFRGMEKEWDSSWQKRYNSILDKANEVHYISTIPGRKALFARNDWMVDRSSLLLAVYNGAPGGTQKIIDYARRKGLKIELLGEHHH